jgi:tetratricopeptide (TPR) repeat protein/predicted transcriptional regulator
LTSPDILLELVAEREDILYTLTGGPLAPRDIIDDVDISRSTFNRAIRELDGAGLVDRSEGNCALTLTGQLALDRYRAARREIEGVVAAERALDPLDPDAPVDPTVLVDAETYLADDPTPYRPKERLHEVVRTADRYRAVLPALDDPRHARLLYEHVVTDGLPAKIVVTEELADSLADEFPRQLAAMAETDGFDLHAGDVPAFGLVAAEDGNKTQVALAVFSDQGIHAVVIADTDQAYRWADTLLKGYRDRSTPVTDEFRQHTDGGIVIGDQATGGPDTPVDLKREGFVRLSSDLFANRRVADPATAWRAGLSLAEVHVGYAIERTVDVGENEDAGDGSRRLGVGDSRETLTDRLTRRLRAGEDCVVVGPPGSGKSTTCKQVATKWYTAGHGPVLYRESGRGIEFDSVDTLLTAVEESDGHPLIVVEDAVRPEARAIFEMLEQAGDSLSFLLDTRESRWRDPPESVAETVENADLTVEPMPRLHNRDRERLIEHFERTVGTSVDVAAERLREGIDREIVPGETLLLLHRLTTYADPLTGEETTLEAAARAVYEEAATVKGVLDVAVAANLLNAAGVSFDPGVLRAVTAGDELETALDLLDDRVLFGVVDGVYLTIHETWSVAFIEALLNGEGESAARERVCCIVSGVLALADDPALSGGVQTPSSGEMPDRVAAPSEWADRTVEALFVLCRERPKFAVLLGDTDGPGIEIPQICESATAEKLAIKLGLAFLDAGEHDRAKAIFEREQIGDGAETDRGTLRRLLGMARAHKRGNEYDATEETAQRCLSLAEEAGDRWMVARAREVLGDLAFSRTDYDRATTWYERALADARELGDRRLEAGLFHDIGRVAEQQAEFESARERYKQSLAAHREVGDRRGKATVLKNLGTVALRQGEMEAARGHTEQALEILRGTGDRRLQARVLHNLGSIALRRDEYDRAREYFEWSLEIKREIDDKGGEASTLLNLGVVEHNHGAFDRATDRFESGLNIAREIGARHTIASCLTNLGNVALDRCEYDTAREFFERSIDLEREIGDRRGVSIDRLHLGDIAKRQSRFERAREHYEACLETRRDLGTPQLEAEALSHLGQLSVRLEDNEEAQACFERAFEIAHEVGGPREEADSRRGLASVARRQGAYDRARRHIDEAVSLVEKSDQAREIPTVRLEASRLALSRGNNERAHELATTAKQSFTNIESSVGVAESRLVLGQVAVTTADHESAREHWKRALETFEEINSSDAVLRTLRKLAESCRERGDHKQAREWHDRARSVLSNAPDAAADLHRKWVVR